MVKLYLDSGKGTAQEIRMSESLWLSHCPCVHYVDEKTETLELCNVTQVIWQSPVF